MATISPFRAWRYAQDHTPIRQVVTQPYDKITPAMQASYYDASPYNLVRIILGRRLPGDTASENVYSRAAASFQNWRQTGVLRQDSAPSLYRYSQTFKIPGSQTVAERRAFIALGKIEDYSVGVVFRHEQTLAKPKADRLDLLRATRAHFGQIFMLYNAAGQVDSLLDSASSSTVSTPPDIEVTDEYEVLHRVWKVSDPSVIASVQEKMRDRKLIIADGHHRYETALAYRNERNQQLAVNPSAAPAPHDWVMMTFVDMNCPGLVILPTHRVVFGLPAQSLENFSTAARNFFNIEEVDPNLDAARAHAILNNAGRAGTALLAVMPNRAFLMHTSKSVGSPLFGNLSLRQQSLDVVQLHKCILENCLQISEEAIRDQHNVSYFRETAEALAQIREGKVREGEARAGEAREAKAQIAFLMNPVRMQQVRDIAFAGEVLPQKSTDFFPKLLSGLAIYALE
jgi:uncharacterized protein (DUF1015 family)